ncbi:MAG: M20/M25/M40 family metallo-hydrolase [Planctomycetaceae bacterium]|nr:M20/M25/M40 family metallo-hydrolase [Planctomycetaceae bacterium]
MSRLVRPFLLSVLVLTPIVAWAEEPSKGWDGAIRPEHVRPHVEFLADPKLAGRSGANASKAADYLRQQFQTWKLRPLFPDGKFEQPIPTSAEEREQNAIPSDGSSDVDPLPKAPRIVGRNVGAFLEGSDPELRDELIVIGAHFDHLGVRKGAVYRGADDNASGTAMMLEVARRLAIAKQRPKRSIVFVGFDLEEQLLWGSRWFVAHPPFELSQVKLFITADMIGRSLGDLPLPAVFVMGSEHAPRLKTLLDDVGAPRGLEVARLGVDLIGVRSDYGPFWGEKIPFLFFSTGEHPDYHSPRDVPEKLDFDKIARVSSLVLKVVEAAANSETAPEWLDEIPPDLDEVRAVQRITDLLLKAGEKKPLTDLQRLIVTQAHNKCQQILDRGTFNADDRKWLIRISQLLLLSVF